MSEGAAETAVFGAVFVAAEGVVFGAGAGAVFGAARGAGGLTLAALDLTSFKPNLTSQ